jgi:hypothetical protein
MSITPELVMNDLENYLSLYNIVLSKEAKKTFKDIEEFSYKCNYPCKGILFFSKLIRNSKELQKMIYYAGINPNLTALILEMGYYSSLDTATNYQKGTRLYSYVHDRIHTEKIVILDKAVQYCVKDNRTVLENKDILFAAINFYDKCYENKNMWSDVKLNTEYLTLSHVYGKYDENLWIKFDDIMDYYMNLSDVKLKIRWCNQR